MTSRFAVLLLVAACAGTACAEGSPTVSGRVAGPGGEPVRGAQVALVSYVLEDGTRPVARLGGALDVKTTDAAGRYSFTLPEPVREARVGVLADGLASGWSGPFDVGAEGCVRDFVLERPVTVTGRVVCARTGAGICGAEVLVDPWLRHEPDGLFRWIWLGRGVPPTFGTETDDDGRFAIEGLPPGNYAARATHPDYDANPSDVRSARFPPREGDRDLEVSLDPRSTTTVDGVPLPAGTVRLLGAPRPTVGTSAFYVTTQADGRQLVVFDRNDVTILDVVTGEVVARPEGLERPDALRPLIERTARDGPHAEGTVAVRPAPTQAATGVRLERGAHDVLDLRDGERALAALPSGGLAVIDVATAAVTRTVALSDEPLSALAAAGADGPIAVGTWQRVLLVDRRDLRTVRTLVGAAAQILALASDTSGRRLAAATPLEIVVWDTATGQVLDRAPAALTSPLALSPDGARVAFARDGGVVLREVGGDEQTFALPSPARRLVLPPDALCVVTERHGLRILDPTTGADRRPRATHELPVFAVVATTDADERPVAATASQDALALWDVRSGELLWRRDVACREVWLAPDAAAVCVRDDGDALRAFGTTDGHALRDPPEREPSAPRRFLGADGLRTPGPRDTALGPGEMPVLALSPDGRLALAQDPRRAEGLVVEVNGGRTLLRLAYDITTRNAAFDADGHLLTPWRAGVLVWFVAR